MEESEEEEKADQASQTLIQLKSYLGMYLAQFSAHSTRLVHYLYMKVMYDDTIININAG